MKAKDILKQKGPEVITIGEAKSLSDAIQVLVNNNIGVLLVINDKAKISGIISERDILRAVKNSPDTFSELKVGEIMTQKVLYADYEDDIDYIESVMTEQRIRHLPVMNNKVLVGLISIGDVIKASLKDKRFENKYLMDYISGSVK